MLFAGIGVSDAGYLASVQYHRYSLTHEIASYKQESYTRDTLGIEYSRRIMPWVNGVAGARSGYEHHYESSLYARSYLVLIPEVGIRTRHDYINLKLMWSPAKLFKKISNEEKFPSFNFRFQPSITFTVNVNLQHSLWIPSSINDIEGVRNESKSSSSGKSSIGSSLRSSGSGKPTHGDAARSDK